MSFQQLTIIGNVGRAPELRYTQGGASVCDFSVAVDSSYKDRDGKKVERTDWYRVTVWNKLAEVVAEYLTAGREVLVVADRIEASAYAGKEGEPRASLEITASTVRFLRGGANGKGEGAATEQKAAAPAPAAAPDEVDIPF